MAIYMWREGGGRLPAEYQEVEYLQNSGTQYLNLGLDIKDGYRFVSKLNSINRQTGGGGRITGGYLGEQPAGYYYRLYVGGVGGSDGTNGWSYGFLLDYNNGTAGTASINTDYELEFSWISGNAYLKVDGTTLVSWSATYSTSLPGKVCLMAIQIQNRSYNIHPGLRIYYAKYYNSSQTLVRDLVPCYRKSDNVIGMYDIVNDTFYTNAGSGTFTKGPDVN